MQGPQSCVKTKQVERGLPKLSNNSPSDVVDLYDTQLFCLRDAAMLVIASHHVSNQNVRMLTSGSNGFRTADSENFSIGKTHPGVAAEAWEFCGSTIKTRSNESCKIKKAGRSVARHLLQSLEWKFFKKHVQSSQWGQIWHGVNSVLIFCPCVSLCLALNLHGKWKVNEGWSSSEKCSFIGSSPPPPSPPLPLVSSSSSLWKRDPRSKRSNLHYHVV